jgi:Fic/DOC family
MKAHTHAAHWVAAHHRALPPLLLGVRAGGLVPPRGAWIAHNPAAHTGSHSSPRSNKASAKASHSEDGDAAGTDDGMGAPRAFDAAQSQAPLGGRSAGALNADAGSDGLRGMADGDAATLDAAAAAASRAGDPNAQALYGRLQAGELCWITSLRLAMQCARMHPGTDICVFALTVMDSEGHVISGFDKRARLQGGDGGDVTVRDEDDVGAGAPPPKAQQRALLDELSAAPLLGVSLRPVVDEEGRPISALERLPDAELHQLRYLFERDVPPQQLEHLREDGARVADGWQALCRRQDFAQGMARHGDAIERTLVQQRTRLSTTISAGDLYAQRAGANWLRAQTQVRDRAARGLRPTYDTLLKLNETLGENLKPWNRAEQADRVGARFGVLRHFDVVSGVPPQHFLRADQLRQAMVELFEWFGAMADGGGAPLVVAAQMHQRLLTLHPFADANGRTARLVMDWLLLLDGLPPALLEPDEIALFANQSEAANPRPGTAEQQLAMGLERGLALHMDWLAEPERG